MDINSKESCNFYTLKSYQCQIRAVEVITDKPLPKKKKKWIYVLSLIDNEKNDDKLNLLEIPSLHEYNTPEDAIQDAYAITRLLGFVTIELKKQSRLEILVLYWDYEEEDYNIETVYYDGNDFYPSKTEG